MTQQIQYLIFIRDRCTQVYAHFDIKQVSVIEKTCLGLIKRLGDSSAAILLLIPEGKSNPGLEFPAGIILRSVVLDSVIVYYMFKIAYSAPNPESVQGEIENFCHGVLSDGLNHLLKFMKWAYDLGHIDCKERLDNSYKKLLVDYPDFLEPSVKGDEPIIKYKKQIVSSLKMLQFVHEMTELQPLIKTTKDSYEMYSKLDHFGILYFTVVEMSEKEPFQILLRKLSLLVGYFPLILIVLEKYSDKKEFLRPHINDSMKHFENRVKNK